MDALRNLQNLSISFVGKIVGLTLESWESLEIFLEHFVYQT